MPNAPRTFRPPGMERQSSGKPAPRIDHRESAWQRGYDGDWIAVRDKHRNENPLCEHCLLEGITRPMKEVDHIIPFKGKDDPLRLDQNNLQSLCRQCHAKKTAADIRRGLNG